MKKFINKKTYNKKRRVKKTLADIIKSKQKRAIKPQTNCLKKVDTQIEHTSIDSKQKADENSKKVIKLSVKKADGAKVITFKEEIIVRKAA